ncbi:MAG: class I SAM-dependent methyltransferase, partial [Nitrosarchaeum sp.]|nr:class I SAM-dependent methyltransferase [Nitrosarchaeum sp.]
MKIEEYLKSLPEKIINGDDVQLPDKSFKVIFDLFKLGMEDTFYHLGCGNGKGIVMALKEYNVKKAVGIDNNPDKIIEAKDILKQNNLVGELICKDIQNVDIS